MGILTERLEAIARQAGNLAPLGEPVSRRLEAGNRLAIMAGTTPAGVAVASLKPSTLKHRGGDGPPRAPRGAASRIVSMYRVETALSTGQAVFNGSWPGFAAAAYISAARPVGGFRPVDLVWSMDQLKSHVFK